MKYILSILFFLCLPLSSFANSQIDIETSKKNVQVGENFSVTISLSDINLQQTSAEISLPGIENFEVFSQSVSNSFQNINGVSESLTQFIIQLTAKNTGEFELGPVEILGSSDMRDNEKLNISVSPPLGVTSSQDKENIPEEVSDIIESQTDVRDTQLGGLREVTIPLWAHGAFIVFFVLSFYMLLRYVFSSQTPQKVDIPDISNRDNSGEYRKYFQTLSGEVGQLTSQDFFHQYNLGVRKIFADITESDTSTATLYELQKNTQIVADSRFPLFCKSYKHEYSGVGVSSETQKKYIDDILKLL